MRYKAYYSQGESSESLDITSKLVHRWRKKMAKCTVCLDFDTQMNPIEPCENTGWPELDNLCPLHFGEYLIQPAINRAYDSNVFVAELQQKLYNVEVAQGLRPSCAESVKSELSESVIVDGRDSETANKTRVPPTRVRPSFAKDVTELLSDLEEME